MYISINWIKDFVDLEGIDVKELIYKFTMSTAEVEGIVEYGKDTYGIVVGKVLKVEEVENSKKLHKLLIDTGDKEVKCICGAPNVKEGIKVAFATEGSKVCGFDIKAATIAGHESFGMCLSEKELGISDDNSGIMILDDDIEVGTDIKKTIPIDDIVYEIDNKSLTNRPDLWGHYGIAREIAALTGRKLKPLEVTDLSKYDNLKSLDIDIKNKELCYRYSAITIDNITKKKSSYKVKTRLTYCGLRPISLLVDLTNYIMLELGQPMHAFDKDFIKKIEVNTLSKGEKFITLDGITRDLPKDTLMIFNENNPVAIAGVMGGENTQITSSTKSVFLESANFNAVSVRKTASKLALRTDASARYEKTLDPMLTKIAVERFVKLLENEDNKIKVSSKFSDVYVYKYPDIKVNISLEYINKKVGVNLTLDSVVNILKSLEFDIDILDDENIIVHVSSFRATKDISSKADIIEEISRIYGYDNIVPQTNFWKVEPVKKDEGRMLEYNSKKLLAEKFGMSEIHSYVWYDTKLNNELGIETHDSIKIVNSLNKLDSTLRYNMAPTMLCYVHKNIKNYDEIGIFEVGRTFDYTQKGKDCVENKILAFAISSVSKSEEELLFKAKQIIENIVKINKNIKINFDDNILYKENYIHPINSFVVKYNENVLGYVSVVNPKIKDKINPKSSIIISEIDINVISSLEEKDVIIKPISKYQTVDFDLSIVVKKDIKYSDIEGVINSSKLDYLKGYKLVDVYENEPKLKDKKNITIRFTIESDEKTLTKEEIDNERKILIANLDNNNMKINC